ncbi:MAG: DEAD/DEAH box helicase [Alphaproteobacteria bacterium]
MDNFLSLNLPQPLMLALEKLKFNTPTPIQAQSIPAALEGKDILGTAQTGTGKTGAFGIPLVAKLMINPHGSALVMTPTRELAVQVMDTLQKLLGHQSPIRTALLIGGAPMFKQLNQLRSHPRLIVGTPGRINDHLTRKSLNLKDTHFLVLDETDRMLDMGFSIQIEKIVKHMPPERQTLLFSATLPKDIVVLSKKYLRDPLRVSVGSTTTPVANIKQDVVHTSEEGKYKQLLAQLIEREGSIIIFTKTKYGSERMAKRLRADGHEADALHGDLRQNKRDRVIANFRDNKYRILVATDIAARGLDIPHVRHVINYDLPQVPEDYIHRIGRTARAGAEGHAICFVTPADRGKWMAINRLINPDYKPEPRSYSPEAKRDGRGPKRFKKHRGPAGSRDERGHGRSEYRGDRPHRGERSERSESYKGDRPYQADRKPAGEHRERPQGERKSHGEHSEYRGDRQHRGERTERPEGRKPQGERSEYRGDRPHRGERTERPEGRKPQGERSEYRGDRPHRGERTERPDGFKSEHRGDRLKRDQDGERRPFGPSRGPKKHFGGKRKAFGHKPRAA